MNFDKTGYIPINQANVEIKKDKNVSNPDTTFNEKEPKNLPKEEKAKVYSDLVKSYYGRYNTGYYGGYTSSDSANDNNTDFALKDLTDEEFEQMRAKLQDKIPDVEFNKYNVQIANKILSSPILSENECLKNTISVFLNNVDTKDRAEVAEKILSEKRLFDNEVFMEDASIVLRETDKEGEAKSKIEIIDKILSDRRIYKNGSIMLNASYIIAYPDTEEEKNYKINYLDKLITDPKLSRSTTISECIGLLINSVNSEKKAKVADKILSNEILYNNDNIMQRSAFIILECETEEDVNAKIELMDKILSSDKLCKNKNFMKIVGSVIRQVTPELLKPFNMVLDEIISNDELNENKTFLENTSDIMYLLQNEDDAKLLIELMQKMTSSAKFTENKTFMKCIGPTIVSIQTDENAENMIKFMDTILSNEKLLNDKNFMDVASFAVFNSQKNENLTAVAKLIDRVSSDKKLMNKKVYKKLFENMPSGVIPAFNNEKFMNYYVENIDKIDESSSYALDNYVELKIDGKLVHLKLDDENNISFIGEEQQTKIKKRRKEKTETEFKTADGVTKFEQYGKGEHTERKGYLATITDKDGNVTRILTKASAKNPGVFVVIKNTYDKDGNFIDSKNVGTVENFGKEGNLRKIKREFESPLGVKTKHLVYELKKGSQSHYEIGNKAFDRSFRIKDENTTETRAWGKGLRQNSMMAVLK